MENIYIDLNRLKHLGKGAIIGKTVRIRRPEETIIGDFTIIDDFTYISCAITMGNYCHIGPNVTISGGSGKVTMGNFVGISCGGSVHAESEDYVSASLNLPSVPKEFQFGALSEEIFMEDYVLLGSHCVVLPGVHLPEGFAAAAFTTVTKKRYEPWVLYGGPRAKRLVRREHAKALETGRKLLERKP
jgi:acetyltransferase-like isoleucine patch superfamily enzyme